MCLYLEIHALNPGCVASLIPGRGREEGKQAGKEAGNPCTQVCLSQVTPEPVRLTQVTDTSPGGGKAGEGARWPGMELVSGLRPQRANAWSMQESGNPTELPFVSHKHRLGG